jgi:hypothetical protein
LVEYQTISIALTGVGMIIALSYYALQIRNQNTTRQAQLFIQITNNLREEKFQNLLFEIRQWEANSIDDYMEKYRNPENMVKLNYVTSFFEGVGVLVKNKFLNPKLVYDLMAYFLFNYYGRFSPFIGDYRVRINRPKLWKNTEYLYQLMMEMYREEYGHEYSL